jgi:pimeloyl-ACP methyl ester carboxylesterase
LREIRPGRVISVSHAPGHPDSRLTIFLCHGAGGNKNQWRFLWQPLAAAGHRLVAWDCYGHGASPQPRRRAAYAGAALVEDYRAVFESYATSRNLLVGHSYGTRLTLAVLADLTRIDRLDRVAGALLLGPPAPAMELGGGPMAYLPAFVLEWLRPRLAEGFRRLAWHPDCDPALIDYEEAATQRNSLFMMKALTTQAAILDPARLAALALPVTILAGEADRLTPPSGAELLAAALPQAELQVIARSGHQIMLEQPAAVLRVLDTMIGAAGRD